MTGSALDGVMTNYSLTMGANMKSGFYWMFDCGNGDRTIVFICPDESVQTMDGELHHADSFRSDRVLFFPIDSPESPDSIRLLGSSLNELVSSRVPVLN